MQNLLQLLPFVVICLVALTITVVLFKHLDSSAEGEGTALNGKVKYGGALAGFVVVSGVLSSIYVLTKPEDLEISRVGILEVTEIDIAGRWEMRHRFVDLETEELEDSGRWEEVCIHQKRGVPSFTVEGYILSQLGGDQDISFRSSQASIEGQKLEFTLLTNTGESAKAQAYIASNDPRQMIFEIIDQDEPDGRDTLEMRKLDGNCRI